MAGEIPKERKRLIGLILISFLLLGFFLIILIVETGTVSFKTGLLYIALMVMASVVIFFWDKIPKKRKDFKLYGIQDDWFLDLLVGVGIAGVFLFLRNLLPLTFLGWIIPTARPLATGPQVATVLGIAPGVEEVFFRVVTFAIFFAVLGWHYLPASIISNVMFSAYHVIAYANELALDPIISVSGAFITAFLAGMVMDGVNFWRGSVTTSIGTHFGLNFSSWLSGALSFG